MRSAPTSACPHCGAGELPEAWLGGAELTPRQRTILALVLQGYSNLEIAQALFVSSNTVKYHVKLVYLKLGFRHSRRRAAHGDAVRPASHVGSATMAPSVKQSSACSF